MVDDRIAEADEIRRLVGSGLSLNAEDAAKVVNKRKRLDGYVFYHQDATSLVREAFEFDVFEEEIYSYSQLRASLTKLGRLGNARRYGSPNQNPNFSGKRLAITKLIELVPKNHLIAEGFTEKRDGTNIQRAGYCKNLGGGGINGGNGFVLTPYSQAELRERGVATFTERSPRRIEPIEYQPLAGDDIFGMFAAFNSHSFAEQRHLVLWGPRNIVTKLN